MGTDNQKFNEMRALVSRWRASGMGKKAFCAAHNINIHTFTYWVEKAEKSTPSVASVASQLGFIALREPEGQKHAPKAHEASLELLFPKGAILQMTGALSAESVALVKSLLY